MGRENKRQPDKHLVDAFLLCQRPASLKESTRGWESLVSRSQRRLYNYIRRLGVDPDDASDLLQEVYLRLIRSIFSISSPKKIESWLYTTARHVCYDAGRKMARRPKTKVSLEEQECSLNTTPSEGLNPSEAVEREEELAKLKKFFASQEGVIDDLDLLKKHVCDNVSQREIAKKLGTTTDAVRMRIARARKKMKAIYEKTAKNEQKVRRIS